MTDGQDGACFEDAMKQAGYGINAPNWIKIEDISHTVEHLGLVFHSGAGNVEVGVQPLVVLYETRPGVGHAKYVEDIGPLIESGKEIIGVIILPTKQEEYANG